MSVSQPSSGFALQCAHPAAHEEAGTEHVPFAPHDVVPETCGRPVHEWPHVPQLFTSSGTQLPAQSSCPVGQPGGPLSGPASTTPASLDVASLGELPSMLASPPSGLNGVTL
jgi:hypothetical protein